jgi:hypothetical protein
VNAIVTMADSPMDAAKKAEAAVKWGGQLGPLHGVPFTVKDGIDTAGVRPRVPRRFWHIGPMARSVRASPGFFGPH